MRKFLICVALACAPITACTTVATPGAISSQTKVDEQAAITAHLAYKAFRLAVETGINAGFIKGQTAARVADLDNRIFAALGAVDAAYKAGNSADYAAAVANFNIALTTGYSAIGGK